jgi:Protein of unknown function (DUF3987)
MTNPQPNGQVESCNHPFKWLQHLYGDADGWVTIFSAHDGHPAIDWGQTNALVDLAEVALRRAEDSDVWFGVATRKQKLDRGRRGSADDCLMVVGLWADIDIAGPNHKGARNLPADLAAANQLVGDFPLPPTAIVKSGGGLQPWWLFNDPVAVDKTVEQLLAAWGATWAELGRRRSWHVDNVFDVPRIMRLPGTWNRKQDVPVAVTAKAIWSRRYDPADFEPYLLDAPAAPEPAAARIPYIGPERPGDAFNAVRRGSDILHIAGFTPGRRDRSSGEEHWVRPGKEKRAGTSATVYPDGHTTIWSETVRSWWPAVEVRRPYDPFGLYTVICHDGDFTASSDALATQGYGTKACATDDLSWAEPPATLDVVLDDDEKEEEAPEPPPWPEMPPAAYHGLLGEVTAELAPQTEADPVGILACLLTYFGAAVGPGPHFRLSGATHSARINVLIVGDSARARKGSAEAMARWVMRAADAAITSERRASGLNSGEGLIEAVRDPKWTKDKKGEDVLIDEGVKDKRLLLYEPEFAGRLLTAIKRSGATISAVLRMAWDEGNLQTMNSRNPLRATGAHICVIGNATIEELLLEMSARELASGLLNRFLFVAVRSINSLPFGGELDDLAVEQLGRRIRERLEKARVRGRLEFDEHTRDPWPAAYEALRNDVPDGPLGHMTARGSVQVQRLALIYALADGADAIGLDHLEAAVAFWSYCRESAELVLNGDGNEQLTGNADGDRLLRLLVQSARPWPANELQAELRWNGVRVAAARARLEKLGLVKVSKVSGPSGRPKTVVEAR